MKEWELSVGLYPGLLIGVRSYAVSGERDRVDHVFYLPLIDLCLTVYEDKDITIE